MIVSTILVSIYCECLINQDTSIGGNRVELEVASSMAVRTIAALSFTKAINDSLRQVFLSRILSFFIYFILFYYFKGKLKKN